VKEWSSDYHGFNDWKVAFHAAQLRAIAAWLDGDPHLPAPVAVDTDPSNRCQQRCTYCNAWQYRRDEGFHSMPPGHLLKLAEFYAAWGVQSTCIAGGGEPLCNSEVPAMVARCAELGVEVGMITNGVLLTHCVREVLVESARFCGVSFDGATNETYRRMRGVDHFDCVLANVASLCEARSKARSRLDVNLKYLIHPWNYRELLGVARIAKDIGCNGVHIRPVGLDNVPGAPNPMAEPGFDHARYASEVNALIEQAWELEDDTFRVYAVRHKFGANLQRVIRFDACRCTPLAAVFGADGWVHLCFNMRGRDGYRLCEHTPEPREVLQHWGSDRHRDMVRAIDPQRCIRCAFTRYNEVIQHCVLSDDMFCNFL